MNILHVEAGKHLYGGARQVQYLLEGLQQHGVTNVLACPKGAAIGAACEPFSTVEYLPWSGDTDLVAICRLKALIKRHNIDLIHAHSRRGADWFCALAAKWAGIPCVISRRVDNPESPRITQLKYGMAASVVAISQGIGDVLLSQGLPNDKLQVVPSAVDTSDYQREYNPDALKAEFSIPKDCIVFGQIAQLIKRKGHDTTFTALKTLIQQHSNAHLIVFGQGPREDELKALAKTMDIAEHVTFAGFRSDLTQWIGALDVVVHPATMEGLGVALLQAGAAGVPVIGGNAGGIPEIVLHEKTGYLVEPGDDTRLAETMLSLHQNALRRIEYGEALKAHVAQRFSIESMVMGNLTNYQAILAH